MARLSDADQGGLSLPRFDPSRPHRPRPCAVHGPGPPDAPVARHRHPGMAELLLQVADVRPWALSGARFVHPAHEAEEHIAPSARGGTHHALGARILRLTRGHQSRRNPAIASSIEPCHAPPVSHPRYGCIPVPKLQRVPERYPRHIPWRGHRLLSWKARVDLSEELERNGPACWDSECSSRLFGDRAFGGAEEGTGEFHRARG